MYTCSYDGILGVISAMEYCIQTENVIQLFQRSHLRYEISAENKRKEK